MLPALPRIVLYHQTHHTSHTATPIPLTPLLALPSHLHKHLVLIVAAVHLNTPTSSHPTPHITLNNDAPSAPKFSSLRASLPTLRAAGVTITALLGGAAKGSFAVLDGDGWEEYYGLLYAFLKEWGMQGVDLDVEETMSLTGILRLIRLLKRDFGEAFLVTLSPVATALQGGRHISGFCYEALEREAGNSVAWYNAQFYCGWGCVSDAAAWRRIRARGWDPERVVAGVVTNPQNAGGFVEGVKVAQALAGMGEMGGGVAGWEYFNALPAGEGAPWMWVLEMAAALGLMRERVEVEVEVEVDVVRERRLRRFA